MKIETPQCPNVAAADALFSIFGMRRTNGGNTPMKTKKVSKSKMKPITRNAAEKLLNSIDMEGLWYALREGYLDELHGTNLEKVAEEARVSMLKFEKSMDSLREKFDIEVL